MSSHRNDREYLRVSSHGNLVSLIRSHVYLYLSGIAQVDQTQISTIAPKVILDMNRPVCEQ